MSVWVIEPLLKLNVVMVFALLTLFLLIFILFSTLALERMESNVVEAGFLGMVLIFLLDFEDNIATVSTLLWIHNVETAEGWRIWNETLSASIPGSLVTLGFGSFLGLIGFLLLFHLLFSSLGILYGLNELLDTLDLLFLPCDNGLLLDYLLLLDHHLLSSGLLVLVTTTSN